MDSGTANQTPINNPPQPINTIQQPISQLSNITQNPLQSNEDTKQKRGSILRTLLVIFTLIFINPLGLILMFTISRWKKWIKILIFVLCVPFYIIFVINLGNFIWRFKADRQISDTHEVCFLQCWTQSQDSEIVKQCIDDCLKNNLDPNIYKYWYESINK